DLKKLIFPLCNREPSTAPTCCGRVFGLCWRCTGLIIGVMMASICCRLWQLELPLWPALLSVALITLDWCFRDRGWMGNARRWGTGLAFGFFAAGALLSYLG
ncbi:MAG: DUF2085 domain-containing protein, partial [Planctomycetota bacterium]|nr:DUF2085 domain-containing protein [Planctomycetota bacterium]